MLKTKKIIKTILSAVFTIILLFAVYAAARYLPLLYYANSVLWENSAEFDTYETEFVLIKDYALTKRSDTERVLIYNRQDITLIDCGTLERLTPPDDVKTALDTIAKNAFPCKYATFDTVRIYDDCVSFVIENGQYGLVYSPTKKTAGIAEGKDSGFIVKKIRGGWYHVVHDPNG